MKDDATKGAKYDIAPEDNELLQLLGLSKEDIQTLFLITGHDEQGKPLISEAIPINEFVKGCIHIVITLLELVKSGGSIVLHSENNPNIDGCSFPTDLLRAIKSQGIKINLD